MIDLSTTIATILASELGDPDQIQFTIRQVEGDLATLEHRLAEAEGKALAAETPEQEVDDLVTAITSLTLKVKRRSSSLDKLCEALDQAVKARARAKREEHLRQVTAERDEVAALLKERYPELAGELASLLDKVASSELACRGLNIPGPESSAKLGPLLQYTRLPALLNKGG